MGKNGVFESQKIFFLILLSKKIKFKASYRVFSDLNIITTDCIDFTLIILFLQ